MMKQQKTTNKVIALLLVVLLVLGTAPAALAADGETSADPTVGIIYQGQFAIERWLYQNPDTTYTATDLFPNLKGVMPGDQLQQDFIVKNNSGNAIKLFVQVLPHDAKNPLSEGVEAETTTASSIAFLNQLEMKITVGEGQDEQTLFDVPKGQLGTYAGQKELGTLQAKQGAVLHVYLNVPIELGNEFMYLAEQARQGNATGIGELDLAFTIEEQSGGGGGESGGGGNEGGGGEPPEEEIPDPDVPKTEPDEPVIIPGTPVDEIDDPDVPLKDAPKTGDTTNIMLMLGLLVIGAMGLYATRRAK
ncbi:MAG: LPXTG cell wall anchor domain-containing protein [Peptococcaceae bacterium]